MTVGEEESMDLLGDLRKILSIVVYDYVLETCKIPWIGKGLERPGLTWPSRVLQGLVWIEEEEEEEWPIEGRGQSRPRLGRLQRIQATIEEHRSKKFRTCCRFCVCGGFSGVQHA